MQTKPVNRAHMRIGLVQFLNARPLDYGLRKQAALNPDLKLVEDVPARLVDMLLQDQLDAALISSVECLRNSDRLSYLKSIGVCARSQAESLFYIKSKKAKRKNPASPVRRILADRGSRTTIALLKILYLKKNDNLPEIILCDPEKIPAMLEPEDGGLLIGDAAMRFRVSSQSKEYSIVDLASWWHQSESLPFVFALWAYPHNKIIPDGLFEDSLLAGEKNMEEIIAAAQDLPDARNYLTNNLHYRLGAEEWESLERFKVLLNELPEE